MAVDIYPVRQVQVQGLRLDLGRARERIKGKIDGFVEYPGSIRSIGGGDGWWRFPEWLGYRIDQALEKRGERV